MKRILVEGRNVVLKRGTGIATYCRQLAWVHGEFGYQSDVLFQTDFNLRKTRPDINEINLYDFEARQVLPYERYLQWLFNPAPLVTDWWGVEPKPIANSGLIADTSVFKNLKHFQNRYGVRGLFDRANKHFSLFNRFLPVHMPTDMDLFHATHPTPIRVENCPNIYTVHDLVPLRLPHTTLDHKRLFLRTLKTIAEKADHVVTVSEQTRKDMIQFIGIDEDRITNTYQTADFPTAIESRSDEETRRDLKFLKVAPGDYYFFLGALEPKKNIKRLLDAFLASGSKRKLVVAGPQGWSSSEEITRITQGDFTEYHFSDRKIMPERQIIHLSYVPLYLVLSLMRHARALLFPSLYEGFGLPALEAMKCGTAVLTSNTASLPEVVGDAAVLVDPYDTMDILRGIMTLDEDDDLCRELGKKGLERAPLFSMERYKERLGAVYSRFL